jgi:hypothetical protein
MFANYRFSLSQRDHSMMQGYLRGLATVGCNSHPARVLLERLLTAEMWSAEPNHAVKTAEGKLGTAEPRPLPG